MAACAGACATMTLLGMRFLEAFGALWSVGIVCACGCFLNARSTNDGSCRCESVLGGAAMLSAAAISSFFVLRRPHCRLFVASLRRSSWTDALLFLPSATGFFMPAACGGVEYPWEFWTSLVPMVVGIAAVSTLLAQQNCFAVRRHACECLAAVLSVTLAALQVVALSAMLCIVLLRLETPEAAVMGSHAESRASMLVLLSIAVAVAVAAAVTAANVVSGVARWAARSVPMILARHAGVAVVLGAAIAWPLPRLIGEIGTGLGASALALWRPALVAVGNRAWLASAQALVRRPLSPSLAVAASFFLRSPANKSVLVSSLRATSAGGTSPGTAGLAPRCEWTLVGGVNDLLKVSCTDSLRWVRVAVTAASATALLSSVCIKIVDAARSRRKETQSQKDD